MRTGLENFMLSLELEWDGDVEFGFSWAVVEIVRADIVAYHETDDVDDDLMLGWYMIRQDSLGFVYVDYFARADEVEAVRAEFESDYSEWLDA